MRQFTVIKKKVRVSRDMTKPTKWVCAHRRLRSAWASAQSDQSSLCAQWVAMDPSFLHADSEDSDQTGLLWVFAGRTAILLVLSCRGSCMFGLCPWLDMLCLSSSVNKPVQKWLITSTRSLLLLDADPWAHFRLVRTTTCISVFVSVSVSSLFQFWI